VWAEGRRKPLSAEKLALALPAKTWRIVQWRAGTGKRLSSRFAPIRVRAAHRKALRAADPRAQAWLLLEWPQGEKKPTKYRLTTLPNDIACSRLVDIAKLRWRIERDYQELKQAIGLGHFAGRGWRGCHHHATLCIATYGFLVSERKTISPSGHYSSWQSEAASLPNSGRSDGSPLTSSTPYSEFDHHAAIPSHLGSH
jgi:SRSO17 transposase